MHERETFGLFAIIGDLGGVHEIFLVTISMILGPIAHHSFIVKTAKNLFYARTISKDIFHNHGPDSRTQKFFDSELLSNVENTEIKTHKTIHIDRNKMYTMYFIQ